VRRVPSCNADSAVSSAPIASRVASTDSNDVAEQLTLPFAADSAEVAP
jgi:hypothetical protein